MDSKDPIGGQSRRYIDGEQCGLRYGISARHWRRLVDAGKAPRPIRLGRSVRWCESDLSAWEANGCSLADTRHLRDS